MKSILAKLLSVFRKINWFYALGEVFLIFIGISLALWFNNWNESLKLQKLEKETLLEIRHEILLDTVDLRFNIRGYENVVYHDSILARYWLNRLPVDSVLNRAISRANSNFSIIFHYSAYKTLQSRGLEIIRNDSLRQAIVRLYDFSYQSLELYENREYSVPDVMFLESNYLLKHFYMVTTPEDYSYLTLKDPEAFYADKDFYTVHKIMMIQKEYRLRQYARLYEKMMQVAAMIEKEIQKL